MRRVITRQAIAGEMRDCCLEENAWAGDLTMSGRVPDDTGVDLNFPPEKHFQSVAH